MSSCEHSINIPRGFRSSNDPRPCYLVYSSDEKYIHHIALICACGEEFSISTQTGTFIWKHCIEAELVLEDFHKLFEVKKKKKKT